MSIDRSLEYVQSLARGLSVISCFSERRPAMTISAVAEETGLSRATARRVLHTLQQLDLVATDGDVFRLTPRVLSIGYAYLSSLELPELAHPHMEQLVAQVRESSSLAVLDGADIVYVARVPTKRIMSVAITVGTRLPAFATSMGRALLADRTPAEVEELLGTGPLPRLTSRTVGTVAELRKVLDRVRDDGFALTDQELEDGLRSIAVPVRDARGVAQAALNVAAHAGRVSARSMVEEFLPPLREAARRIETDVRHRPGVAASGLVR
jgi:IclR family transcriptional regulator, pca regulon regulatory protein